MRELKISLSEGLWRALHARAQSTDEPVRHLVSAALAAYLGLEHNTLFQASTSGALVKGVYQGAVRIGTLRAHGDLGLGTFENLDGEMVVVDGKFFQVRGDGSVHEVADDVLSPFAIVTHFTPDHAADLARCPALAALTAAFDELRPSDNVFFAVRVDGRFDYVRTRAMCRTDEGVPLATAAATQPEFELHGVSGTLVGFWTPAYATTIGIPGYHLHFISEARDSGGHLLECRGRDLRLRIQREGTVRIALPETADFLQADLTGDPTAALEAAEKLNRRR